MSTQKRMGLGLGAATVVLAIVAALVAGSQVFAQGGTISADSLTIGPGGQGTIDLEASNIDDESSNIDDHGSCLTAFDPDDTVAL